MRQLSKPAEWPVRRVWAVGMLSLMFMLAWFQTAQALDKTPPPENAIVWLADVSGSMPEIDPHNLWVNAVSLGVDLAPENSQLAFIAANDAVQGQTALLDVAQPGNGAAIKQASQAVKCTGYTDFSVGLSAALQLLKASPAKGKDIFFIGDISESGFLLPNGNDAQTGANMAA
ncbi:MAG: VWA domain-containing protein, partial [Firmicutes bacterium]|nr:VWA domain-containing protein [Bacillota bacterium]